MATGATYVNGQTGQIETEDLVEALGGPFELDDESLASVVASLIASGLFVAAE